MSVPQPQQSTQNGQALPHVPNHGGAGPSIELVDELLGETDLAEYRLKRGDKDEIFEGLHDKSASLTILNEVEVTQRGLMLDVERDLLSMRLPRPGSPWVGETRAMLMGDDNDKREPADEVAFMRNYRIAYDRARQSRRGGKLLELLLKSFNISEMRDSRGEKKKPWYKRLFPTGGGR